MLMPDPTHAPFAETGSLRHGNFALAMRALRVPNSGTARLLDFVMPWQTCQAVPEPEQNDGKCSIRLGGDATALSIYNYLDREHR